MEYKLPPLPNVFSVVDDELVYTNDQLRQYAEQAVAPLLAEIDILRQENKWWKSNAKQSLELAKTLHNEQNNR